MFLIAFNVLRVFVETWWRLTGVLRCFFEFVFSLDSLDRCMFIQRDRCKTDAEWNSTEARPAEVTVEAAVAQLARPLPTLSGRHHL